MRQSTPCLRKNEKGSLAEQNRNEFLEVKLFPQPVSSGRRQDAATLVDGVPGLTETNVMCCQLGNSTCIGAYDDHIR